MEFSLHPGEGYRYKHKSGRIYNLMCDLFKDHDHKKKPLYYYYSEEKCKSDDIVAIVEGRDAPYDSPYCAVVTGNWTVFRKDIIISFSRVKNYLQVEIKDKMQHD